MEKGGGALRGNKSLLRKNTQVEKWLDYTFDNHRGEAVGEKKKVVSVKAAGLWKHVYFQGRFPFSIFSNIFRGTKDNS